MQSSWMLVMLCKEIFDASKNSLHWACWCPGKFYVSYMLWEVIIHKIYNTVSTEKGHEKFLNTSLIFLEYPHNNETVNKQIMSIININNKKWYIWGSTG